jgi:hypothetical protein
LGYYQYVSLRIRKIGVDVVSLRIRKIGVDVETLRIAINLSFPEFFKWVNDWSESPSIYDAEETIHITMCGKAPLYKSEGLLFEGRVKLQKFSEELGCIVEVYYEGEEKEDGEQVTYENGRKTKHKVIGWVDAVCS